MAGTFLKVGNMSRKGTIGEHLSPFHTCKQTGERNEASGVFQLALKCIKKEEGGDMKLCTIPGLPCNHQIKRL